MGKVARSGKEITQKLYPNGRPETEEYADRCAANHRALAASRHRSLVVVEEIKPRSEPRLKSKRQLESERTRAKWEAARAARASGQT